MTSPTPNHLPEAPISKYRVPGGVRAPPRVCTLSGRPMCPGLVCPHLHPPPPTHQGRESEFHLFPFGFRDKTLEVGGSVLHARAAWACSCAPRLSSHRDSSDSGSS